MTDALKRTPLYDAHVAAGARLVPFGGYDMPVQYRDGILAEHRWTREHAGLFDVSHMGPSFLKLTAPTGDPEADHAAIAAVLEPLLCGDIRGLKRGQLRYSLLMADDGGILDDLMVGRPVRDDRQGMLQVVVNAGTKDADFARIAERTAGKAQLIRADDRALIAVQGREAAALVADILPEAAELSFMTFRRIEYQGHGLSVSRSGYTGEDGYEILVPAEIAMDFWNRLAADARAKPIGLGARDSLRLEAGLPLYGHDINEATSPVDASLTFALSKRRLRDGDILGAARIAHELEYGTAKVRVGLNVLEGAPAREGAEIADASGAIVGVVTSGGFSPSLSRPIAMGYVAKALAEIGTPLKVIVRGKAQAAEVVSMPFFPHRYVRKT
jgi:aminomethyltransferase